MNTPPPPIENKIEIYRNETKEYTISLTDPVNKSPKTIQVTGFFFDKNDIYGGGKEIAYADIPKTWGERMYHAHTKYLTIDKLPGNPKRISFKVSGIITVDNTTSILLVQEKRTNLTLNIGLICKRKNPASPLEFLTYGAYLSDITNQEPVKQLGPIRGWLNGQDIPKFKATEIIQP